jgi:hypothetical protein
MGEELGARRLLVVGGDEDGRFQSYSARRRGWSLSAPIIAAKSTWSKVTMR